MGGRAALFRDDSDQIQFFIFSEPNNISNRKIIRHQNHFRLGVAHFLLDFAALSGQLLLKSADHVHDVVAAFSQVGICQAVKEFQHIF